MRLIKSFFIIVALIFPGWAQSLKPSEEYAVYNAVLKSIYEDEIKYYPNHRYYVIYQQTKTDEDLKLGLAERYPGLIEDFMAKNKQSTALESKLVFAKYFFVDDLEIKKYFDTEQQEIKAAEAEAEKRNVVRVTISADYWRPFYEKYPKAFGLYRLSRVGFANNKRYAAVQVIRNSSLTGFSRTYLIRKIGTRWNPERWSGTSSIS
jgi:hypothetical protein